VTPKDLARFGCVVLLAMAVAFIAGIAISGGSADRARGPAGSAAAQREVYSPKVLSDPYFVDQQRRNAEALERRCREAGEMCAEAEALRGWLGRHD
jgi:hypothetical protein